jgi:hypothetical protein
MCFLGILTEFLAQSHADWKSYCSVIKWKSVPEHDMPYLAMYRIINLLHI